MSGSRRPWWAPGLDQVDLALEIGAALLALPDLEHAIVNQTTNKIRNLAKP